ncbi:alpha/beta hydrolase-fold protein [Alkalihalobacillus sp. R86527]|uniref:alpha/beta hydrolase-fold protein n=1 Tax=Alkalihalobacillus sp. R86527 TaxID=3093863 RepID=UPI00366F4388
MNIKEIQSPYIKEINIDYLKSLDTPIVNSVDDGIEVHFIYIGNDKTSSVHVLGSFPGWELQKGEMTRIEGSEIWVKSFLTRTSFASTYYFSVNDEYGDNWGERFKHLMTDPLNRKKMVFSESPDGISTELSYVEANEYLSSMSLPTENHKLYKEVFKSELLHNERDIWIYDPIETNEIPKNVVIVFDGFQYTEAIPVPTMIDHLYEEGKLPPTVMIGVDSPDRFAEFNGNERFTQFISDELLPWVHRRFKVSRNPKDIALCGASLGGLAAFYSVLTRSDLFGNVISQSGSFNHKKIEDEYWAVHYIETEAKHPVRIYMNAGRLEMDALQDANKQTHQALMRKDYDVTYEVFNGGHDVLWWRETFLRGLESIFSDK